MNIIANIAVVLAMIWGTLIIVTTVDTIIFDGAFINSFIMSFEN